MSDISNNLYDYSLYIDYMFFVVYAERCILELFLSIFLNHLFLTNPFHFNKIGKISKLNFKRKIYSIDME